MNSAAIKPAFRQLHPRNSRPLKPSIRRRTLASVSVHPRQVNLVEVGPRDGLQNEKAIIPPEVKIKLVNKLGDAGMNAIESGSFVSPKWVPQMAGTSEVIQRMKRLPGVRYPVLIPNMKGLENLLSLLASARESDPQSPPPADEIAVFAAATDAFSRANTNCTVKESLERLEPVVAKAAAERLKVRGYVSVVITCPYTGKVDCKRVRDVTKALLEMGCTEVGLGDTTGTGSPETVLDMLSVVTSSTSVPVKKLGGHFHDTFGSALANIFSALSAGVRTFDSSIAGLGGCPYSPGATGNVATEDVVYALQDSGYEINGNPDLQKLVDVGFWISEKLGRENASRAGKALLARRLREKSVKQSGAL